MGCQNPCRLSNPCRGAQQCVVADTLPTRSVACICPDGTVAGSNGECKEVQVRPECFEHADCPLYDVCDQGNCIDACRVTSCGANARCENKIHSASCICLPNYIGNPRVACNPPSLPTSPQLSVG